VHTWSSESQKFVSGSISKTGLDSLQVTCIIPAREGFRSQGTCTQGDNP
jgi:hypothetical protein